MRWISLAAHGVFLLRHRASGIDVDIAIGSLAFEEEAIGRAVHVDAAGVLIPLAGAEDLIVMKAVAHRARDIADIEGIVAATPNLDVRRVRRWLRAFAAALDRPAIQADVERILRARPRGAARRRSKRR